jgi:chromate transporter
VKIPNHLPDADVPQKPKSVNDVFWSFTWLALQGFGGVLAVVQRELVEKKRWLTPQQFVDDWALAQTLPGPNVVNLSLMIGERHFGWRGALAALAGMLCVPLALLLTLAWFLAPHANHPVLLGSLRGMAVVCAGLIAGTGLKLLASLIKNPLLPSIKYGFVAITVIAIAGLRWPLAAVILGIGCSACLCAAHQIRRNEAQS